MVSWRSTASLLLIVLAGCSKGPNLSQFGVVAPFKLTDQFSKPFDSAQLNGKVWIADFMFTSCPGPCPRMSSQMHQVQMQLEGQGIQLVSFTVDPEHDSPEVLAEYGSKFKAAPGVWHFLTGSKTDLNYLARDVFKLGVVDGSLEHSTRFVLVDRTGQIRNYYLSSEPEAIPTLIKDAQALLKS
jgi:cytochrome oxidase Cu insertion factor (SCO1/SenC/PrrC family)